MSVSLILPPNLVRARQNMLIPDMHQCIHCLFQHQHSQDYGLNYVVTVEDKYTFLIFITYYNTHDDIDILIFFLPVAS